MNPVIMPVRTGLEMTRRALESVFFQDIPVNPIVINNDAPDCAAYLRSQKTTLLSFAPAIGLQRLWNVALDIAFSNLGAKYALVINNDVVLHPATYQRLLADGGEFVTAVGSSDPGCVLDNNFDPSIRRRHPDFSCFLIRRECYERVGPFDESLAIYCGDADYHLRMNAAGIDACCLQIPFYHRASGTLKEVPESMRDAICRQADSDRDTFRAKWGFGVGTPEYYGQFK